VRSYRTFSPLPASALRASRSGLRRGRPANRSRVVHLNFSEAAHRGRACRAVARGSKGRGRRRAVYFLCHCPSSRPARELPGTLPYGVRTFLSRTHFARRSPLGRRRTVTHGSGHPANCNIQLSHASRRDAGFAGRRCASRRPAGRSRGRARAHSANEGSGPPAEEREAGNSRASASERGPSAAPQRRGLPVAFLRDLILLELFIEVTARRIDDLRRLGDVPRVFAELADQEGAL
jgi:hypothetical protein